MRNLSMHHPAGPGTRDVLHKSLILCNVSLFRSRVISVCALCALLFQHYASADCFSLLGPLVEEGSFFMLGHYESRSVLACSGTGRESVL